MTWSFPLLIPGWAGVNWPAVQLTGKEWIIATTYLTVVTLGLLVDLWLVFRLRARPPAWPRHVQQLTARPWPWMEGGRIAVILLAVFSLMASTSHIARALGGEIAGGEQYWIIIQSLAFHWLGLGLIAASLFQRHVGWRPAFGMDPRRLLRDIGRGTAFYLAVMPLLWFYAILYQAALTQAGYEPTMQEVAVALTGAQPWWMRIYLLVLGVALAPFFEELFFRGIVLPILARYLGVAGAIGVVSVLFAAIHFHLPSLVPLFIIAVALALAYIYTESIIVPAVMHGLFNAVNLGLMMVLRQC